MEMNSERRLPGLYTGEKSTWRGGGEEGETKEKKRQITEVVHFYGVR